MCNCRAGHYISKFWGGCLGRSWHKIRVTRPHAPGYSLTGSPNLSSTPPMWVWPQAPLGGPSPSTTLRPRIPLLHQPGSPPGRVLQLQWGTLNRQLGPDWGLESGTSGTETSCKALVFFRNPKRMVTAKFKRTFARTIRNNLMAPHMKMRGFKAKRPESSPELCHEHCHKISLQYFLRNVPGTNRVCTWGKPTLS